MSTNTKKASKPHYIALDVHCEFVEGGSADFDELSRAGASPSPELRVAGGTEPADRCRPWASSPARRRTSTSDAPCGSRPTDRLAALRRDLRERMDRSPLRDEHTYARAVEAVYRAMWARECKVPAASAIRS
jgi:hypothetical protein